MYNTPCPSIIYRKEIDSQTNRQLLENVLLTCQKHFVFDGVEIMLFRAVKLSWVLCVHLLRYDHNAIT